MSDRLRHAAIAIVRRLRDAGHEAYWVGGCVRNRLLGLTPEDYDIATSAWPADVQALFPGADLVGASFGVVIVVEDGAQLEIATFRRDGRYIDHRHPETVSFGTLAEDAARRDFTINALFYDPLADRMIDLFGGRRDLADRVLRCIGDPQARFEEDALRLMRAVRFAVRFELTVEPATRAAMIAKAPLLAAISPERVRDELVLMLTGPRRGDTVRTMSQTRLLEVILPEIEALRGVEQPVAFHPEGDVFEHTCLVLDALEAPPPITPTLALAALLHDVGKPATFRRAPDRIRFDRHAVVGAELADAICRRLRFPNREREAIVAPVARHMTFMDVERMKPSRLRRFMGAPTFDEDLALHRADALASHGDLALFDYCVRKRAELLAQEEALVPPPLITGDDLIALGHTPGPRFREMLDAVVDAQMEGAVRTRQEALTWVGERYEVK